MSNLHNELRKEFQLERMILFSDAVFAIAITLLVIEIKVPELHGHEATEKALLHEVGKLVPKFLGFLVSFVLISVYWVIHHRLFGFVTNYSRRLIVLNLFFLFTIVLMPFSTGIYGEYSSPSRIYLITPFAIYVTNICLTGIANFLLWRYVGNPDHKVAAGFPENFIRNAKLRSLVVPGVFFLSLFVDFWNPYVARYRASFNLNNNNQFLWISLL
jgi:TMEM175 potassium channel family protein